MILLIITVCLQADPVTLDCKTAVWDMYQTPLECLAMIKPASEFVTEQAAILPGAQVMAACKSGVVG